jgi:hypothetical protein
MMSAHKPEAQAKENAALRWRFRLVCWAETSLGVFSQSLPEPKRPRGLKMMLPRARWALLLLLLTWTPAFGQDKKYSIKTAVAEPPNEVSDTISKTLAGEAVQFFDPAGKLICEIWLAKELPAVATAEQLKKGITYRELKETQVVGAIRLPKPWHDYRKQSVKAGVYTLRLGFQPADGDHSGKSEFTEFLVMSSAAKDKSAEIMTAKGMQDLSAKSIGTGHPGVLMLFPNSKAGKPTLESMPRDHVVLNVSCGVQAKGSRGTLGFGITLVGEADD